MAKLRCVERLRAIIDDIKSFIQNDDIDIWDLITAISNLKSHSERQYDYGYGDGFDTGNRQGYNEGYDEGYYTGENEGRTIGYEHGYTDGYGDGENYGVEQGYEEGYDEGHTAGYEMGKADGVEDEWNAFWDAFQDSGNRDDYSYGFRGEGWNSINFKPKYDIVPDYRGSTSNAGQGIFAKSINIGSLKAALYAAGVRLDTQYVRNPSNMFDGATGITELPHIDLSSATTMSSVFYGCGAKSISVTLPDREVTYLNCFRSSFLENLEITGTINGTNLNLQWSKNLSKAGIENVINALSATTSGLPATFSKTAVDKAFETSEGANDGSTSAEWTSLVATKPNWTISLA